MTRENNIAIVKQAAHDLGMDEHVGLLLGLIDQESSFNENANSGKALGLAQFTPATALAYGVTDRTNPKQSAEGAAKYIKHLLEEFGGNEEMAIAAYNCGEGSEKNNNGVHGAIRKAREAKAKGQDGDWKSYLPAEETRNHIRKVSAKAAGYSAQAGDYAGAARASIAAGGAAGLNYATRNQQKLAHGKTPNPAGDEEDDRDNYNLIYDYLNSDNPFEIALGLVTLFLFSALGLISAEDHNSLMESYEDRPDDKKQSANKYLNEEQRRELENSRTRRSPDYKPSRNLGDFDVSILDRIPKSDIYPVENSDGIQRMNSEFGERHVDNKRYGRKASTIHLGEDFHGQAGANVKSMFGGRVVGTGGSGGAKFITVETYDKNHHPTGILTKYMHIDYIDGIKEGSEVSAGQTIAKIDNQEIDPKTGKPPYPPHLHVECIDKKSGMNINPKYCMNMQGMGIDYKSNPIKEVDVIDPKSKQRFTRAELETEVKRSQDIASTTPSSYDTNNPITVPPELAQQKGWVMYAVPQKVVNRDGHPIVEGLLVLRDPAGTEHVFHTASGSTGGKYKGADLANYSSGDEATFGAPLPGLLGKVNTVRYDGVNNPAINASYKLTSIDHGDRLAKNGMKTYGEFGHQVMVGLGAEIQDKYHREDCALHIDGSREGTIGCLGVSQSEADRFNQTITQAMNSGHLDRLYVLNPQYAFGGKVATARATQQTGIKISPLPENVQAMVSSLNIDKNQYITPEEAKNADVPKIQAVLKGLGVKEKQIDSSNFYAAITAALAKNKSVNAIG